MKGLWRRAVVAGTALGLDMAGVGLPTRWQPGKWAARGLGWLGQKLPRGAQAKLAAPLAVSGSMVSAVSGRALEVWGRQLPDGINVLAEALLLRSLLSVEAMRRAAADVSLALESGDVDAARVAWAASPALSDVPCDGLTAADMAAIATSRVAALANRGGIAPLFYYAVGGLPGALAYRWLALESGEGHLDRFGRRLASLTAAAPAWITAALLTLAAELRGADSLGAEQVRRVEGGLLRAKPETAPEQAMAGALGVTLACEGGQRVNATGRASVAADLQRAGSIAGVTVGLAGGLLLVGGLVWRVVGPRRGGQ